MLAIALFAIALVLSIVLIVDTINRRERVRRLQLAERLQLSEPVFSEPIMGFPNPSLDQQLSQLTALQTAATTTGVGTQATVAGYNGAQLVEIQESAGGTATVALQGSNDGIVWYSVGYQQVDGVTSPVRSVGAIGVTANSQHVYQVLDAYRYLRANITAIAAASVLARVYAIPV
jgi:hypothetical protein